ncbi:hypothetical protein GCM10029963_78680 [Micromonospora andamanensis]
MSAQPAEDNYRTSPAPRVPFRREADVVSLVPPRPQGQTALPYRNPIVTNPHRSTTQFWPQFWHQNYSA